MEKLNFKFNVCVLISGKGSNLKKLYKFSRFKKSYFQIKLVISNKKEALGVTFAKKRKIKSLIFQNKQKKFETRVLFLIKKEKIKILCLAGFMKILSARFLKEIKIPVINIHPSLLPKFKGLNTHARAIEKKEKFAGCTVHYVTSKLDSGKIILQRKIKILKKDNYKTLSRKVLKIEHKIYAIALNKICRSLLKK